MRLVTSGATYMSMPFLNTVHAPSSVDGDLEGVVQRPCLERVRVSEGGSVAVPATGGSKLPTMGAAYVVAELGEQIVAERIGGELDDASARRR